MAQGLGEAALSSMLSEHGLAPKRFRRIPTGKFNESFFVALADGREVVLRVAPPDDAGFIFYERGMMRQEPGLHRVIREKTRVPVAEILACDGTRELIDRDFLVMERLGGAAVSQTHLSAPAAGRMLEQMGRHLRDLHDSCRAERYGYLGEHECMDPADTWAEAFRTMWAKLVEDIRRCGVYDDDEARGVTGALERNIGHFDRDVPSSLLHMDVWAQNILVDVDDQGNEGHVTGVVDWDRALWGDPEI
ncbi:MAG: phosphotransferase family protein, partial [Planctomycetota bacterium]